MATSRNKEKDAKINVDKHKTKEAKSCLSEDSDDNVDRPLVIKCKTTFKKRIVERALQKEEERDTSDDRNDDPTIKYFLKYSVQKDLLSVGGIEVIVDETEKRLRCSKCTYRTRSKWEKEKRTNGELTKMEFGLRNHIIGQHLGGFPCKECEPVPMFHQSFSAHRKHVMEVHNEHYRELEAMVRRSQGSRKVEPEGRKKKTEGDDGGNVEIGTSSEEEDSWPDGKRRMRRQYKCSYPNCGKKFHKVTRWLRHEKSVHGAVKLKS